MAFAAFFSTINDTTELPSITSMTVEEAAVDQQMKGRLPPIRVMFLKTLQRSQYDNSPPKGLFLITGFNAKPGSKGPTMDLGDSKLMKHPSIPETSPCWELSEDGRTLSVFTYFCASSKDDEKKGDGKKVGGKKEKPIKDYGFEPAMKLAVGESHQISFNAGPESLKLFSPGIIMNLGFKCDKKFQKDGLISFFANATRFVPDKPEDNSNSIINLDTVSRIQCVMPTLQHLKIPASVSVAKMRDNIPQPRTFPMLSPTDAHDRNGVVTTAEPASYHFDGPMTVLSFNQSHFPQDPDENLFTIPCAIRDEYHVATDDHPESRIPLVRLSAYNPIVGDQGKKLRLSYDNASLLMRDFDLDETDPARMVPKKSTIPSLPCYNSSIIFPLKNATFLADLLMPAHNKTPPMPFYVLAKPKYKETEEKTWSNGMSTDHANQYPGGDFAFDVNAVVFRVREYALRYGIKVTDEFMVEHRSKYWTRAIGKKNLGFDYASTMTLIPAMGLSFEQINPAFCDLYTFDGPMGVIMLDENQEPPPQESHLWTNYAIPVYGDHPKPDYIVDDDEEFEYAAEQCRHLVPKRMKHHTAQEGDNIIKSVKDYDPNKFGTWYMKEANTTVHARYIFVAIRNDIPPIKKYAQIKYKDPADQDAATSKLPETADEVDEIPHPPQDQDEIEQKQAPTKKSTKKRKREESHDEEAAPKSKRQAKKKVPSTPPQEGDNDMEVDDG